MKRLLNDLEDHLNQQENNPKLFNEKEHFPLSLKETQWKLRNQHDWKAKATVEQIAAHQFQANFGQHSRANQRWS